MMIRDRLKAFFAGTRLALFHWQGSQFSDWSERDAEEREALGRLCSYPEFAALRDSIEMRQRAFAMEWLKRDMTPEEAESARQRAIGFDMAVKHIAFVVSARERQAEKRRQGELGGLDKARQVQALERRNRENQNANATRRSA